MMPEIPTHLDLDNPRIIARWLWENLPDEVRYREDGTSSATWWVVENDDSRLAIGEDLIDGEGLCWAFYFSDTDVTTGEKFWEDRTSGGWATGDTATAKKEIEYAFGLLAKPGN